MYLPHRHIVTSIPATSTIDWCGELGAHRLAKLLDAWWWGKGYPQVKHWVVAPNGMTKGGSCWAVRSNLINGCPPKDASSNA